MNQVLSFNLNSVLSKITKRKECASMFERVCVSVSIGQYWLTQLLQFCGHAFGA